MSRKEIVGQDINVISGDIVAVVMQNNKTLKSVMNIVIV